MSIDRANELLMPEPQPERKEVEPVGAEMVDNPMRKFRRKLECLMTVKEAAAYLRFSPRAIWRNCRAKKMPHMRIFGRLRFRRAELDAWLDELASQALDPLE